MNANILSEYYAAREIHDCAERKLEKETMRIIKVMTKFFKVESFWWAYSYYSNSDDNFSLPKIVYHGYFPIYIEAKGSRGCVTGDMDYNKGFPIEFFDMSDAEIVKYLQKNVDECAEKLAKENKAKEEKLKTKESANAILKKSALSKLSPAEILALKL